MTEGTIEVELLDSLLDGSPPCGTMCQGVSPCRQPSVVRARLRCPEHGERFQFLCSEHLEELKEQDLLCFLCLPDTINYLRYRGDT